MNINVPNLINTAFSDRDDIRNRNAIIISENSSGPNHNEQGFLSDAFPRNPRKLFVTAETDDFDTAFLKSLRHEGFSVQYFGLDNDNDDDAYRRRLAGLKDVAGLGPCETFAVVAFGEAASLCLEFWHRAENNPEFKLAGLVAYYPTRIPDRAARSPAACGPWRTSSATRSGSWDIARSWGSRGRGGL